MSRNYPPLPFIVRLLLWPLRVLAVVASLAVVALMLWTSTWGEPELPISSLITLLGITVLVWLHPLSPWFLGLLAALGVVTMVGGNPIGGLITMGLAGLIWWFKRRGSPGSGADVSRMEPAPSDAVMVGARKDVRQFEALGYQRVGAYRSSIGPVRITVSLLLSPDLRIYASVTDAIVHLTSLFPGGRALLTRNNELTPLPEHLLVNSESGATPSRLVDSHEQSLALVAERDHYPLTLSAPELTEIAMAGERTVSEWISSGRPRPVESPGPLWQRGGRYQQIDDWHGSARSGSDEPD